MRSTCWRGIRRARNWPPCRARLAEEAALAAGTPHGMVAGQVLDIASCAGTPDAGRLHEIHRLKTGAMIRGAVRCEALLGGAGEDVTAGLTEYGEALGTAFQITDDLLDVTATREELGKTPGKDAAEAKLTFPAVTGMERSRTMAEETVDRALAALAGLGAGIADASFMREHGGIRPGSGEAERGETGLYVSPPLWTNILIIRCKEGLSPALVLPDLPYPKNALADVIGRADAGIPPRQAPRGIRHQRQQADRGHRAPMASISRRSSIRWPVTAPRRAFSTVRPVWSAPSTGTA